MKTESYMIQILSEDRPGEWLDLEVTTENLKEFELKDWQDRKPHRQFRLVRVTTTREVVK